MTFVPVVHPTLRHVVSMFFHHLILPFSPQNDWDTFWMKFIKGEMNFGNYFELVATSR